MDNNIVSKLYRNNNKIIQQNINNARQNLFKLTVNKINSWKK